MRKPPKKKKNRNTLIISISLDPQEAAQAKRLAQRFGLSLSGLIRLLLRERSVTDAEITIRPRDHGTEDFVSIK